MYFNDLYRIVSIRDNIYHLEDLLSSTSTFLVTDDKGNWGIGVTWSKAKASLYRAQKCIYYSEYRELRKVKAYDFNSIIDLYCAITGANPKICRAYWYSLPYKDKKDYYTAQEVVVLSKGKYGHAFFKQFVENLMED